MPQRQPLKSTSPAATRWNRRSKRCAAPLPRNKNMGMTHDCLLLIPHPSYLIPSCGATPSRHHRRSNAAHFRFCQSSA